MAIPRDWLSITDEHVLAPVNCLSAQCLSDILDAKRMGSSATSFTRRTLLIFPVLLLQENNIYAPNDHWLPGFERFGFIYKVTPDYIPSRMIVVRLYCPWTLAALAFQAITRFGLDPAPT